VIIAPVFQEFLASRPLLFQLLLRDLIALWLAISPKAIGVGAAKEGGTFEYVLEVGEQNSPNAVTK
jgi:hypothetical protein